MTCATPWRVVTLALLVPILLACAAETRATPTITSSAVRGPHAAWVLYQGEGGTATSVRLVRADGSDDHAVLSDSPGMNQTNPDWSPDGSQVTFILSRGGTDDLMVVDADGRSRHVLVDCVSPCHYLDDPAWSPDGTKIVYARTERNGARNSLETIDVATGRVRILRRPTTHTFYAGPRWSPDGHRVVCEVVHKRGRGVDQGLTGVVLSVVDVPSGRMSWLTQANLWAATADWSSDGRTIVYSALPSPGALSPDLFSIGPDRSRRTRLTRLGDAGGYAAEPAFAPDGRTIVFSGQLSRSDPPNQLLAVRTVGGRPTLLVDLDARHPRWEPGAESPS